MTTSPRVTITIGELTGRCTIVQPTYTTNPDTGGQVPGDPVIVAADVRALLLPAGATEGISTLGRALQQDLGIINTATHVLTIWFRADVTVGQSIDYEDARRGTIRHFEITQVVDAEPRTPWLVLGVIERVQ